MRKKIFALSLALAFLLALAACGGNAPNHSSDNLPDSGNAPSDVIHQDDASDSTAVPVPPDAPADTPEQTPDVPAEPAVRTVDPSKPMVALTFDDGPHKEYTDQILDILEANGAVATFFQVGRNLNRDPDAVRRAVDLGCEIGSHSYRHDDLGKLSAEAIAADLSAADQAFIKVLGQAPTLLRPPYGSMNYATKATTGRSLVTWSIDTQDWLSLDAQKVFESVRSIGDLNGEVVLMHDTYASTVEAVKVLVPWLLEQGYQLVTVSELINLHHNDELVPNGLYSFSYFRYNRSVEMPPAKPPQPVTPPTEEPVPPSDEPEIPVEDPSVVPDPTLPDPEQSESGETPEPDPEAVPPTEGDIPAIQPEPDPEVTPAPQPDPESSGDMPPAGEEDPGV